MVRPVGHPLRRSAASIHDLREEFLARCQARNLSDRTIQWYEERSRQFAEWCTSREIVLAGDLSCSDLEDFLLALREQGRGAHTVRGFAQILRSLCRFGYRKGFILDNITADFEMPRVPKTIVQTLSDDQLRTLLVAPDARRWVGIRDRAILLTFLDTLIRVSELVGINSEDVDLAERTVRVMGKGRKERELPLGKAATQVLARYRRALEDLQAGDPFFISRTGRRMLRRDVWDLVARYGQRAGIQGVRCSPHTLRHTGAKRFILAGGDVFTLQKLLGHTSLAMVRRYVELADVDVKAQHQRFSPADSLLRRPGPKR
jgi:integrase/recombinase XerD